MNKTENVVFSILENVKKKYCITKNINCPYWKSLLFFLPIMAFIIDLPIFRSSPPLVVGIPVFFAIFCFTFETPTALFHEKLNPGMFKNPIFKTLF